jgi:hypothetical protein
MPLPASQRHCPRHVLPSYLLSLLVALQLRSQMSRRLCQAVHRYGIDHSNPANPVRLHPQLLASHDRSHQLLSRSSPRVCRRKRASFSNSSNWLPHRYQRTLRPLQKVRVPPRRVPHDLHHAEGAKALSPSNLTACSAGAPRYAEVPLALHRHLHLHPHLRRHPNIRPRLWKRVLGIRIKARARPLLKTKQTLARRSNHLIQLFPHV